MPPVSEQQRKFMRAAAANPEMRKREGISKKVAEEFNKADPGGKLPRRKTRQEKRGYKS